ncbi:MAG: DUF167 domain-containing protein [Hylemonella sp.]|nr:DUF167 domain-containing protein [Hylemonella sp.]MDP1938411.1 DUF167 domain-containing protein [Hylemonella sp.]
MPVSKLPFLRTEKDGSVIVDIHVMPNAPQTQIQGLHDNALRVRLKAPPVDGKANLALQAWLAKALGIPRAAIELVRGDTARRKQLRVAARYVAAADWERLTPPEAG